MTEQFDLDEIYGGGQAASAPAPVMAAQPAPMMNMNGVPVYPLSLAQVPAPIQETGFLQRKMGPLPVWGWLVTAVGTGIGGYFILQNIKAPTKNSRDDEDDDAASYALPDEGESAGGWRPSRSAFADQVTRYFAKAGVAGAKVFSDADDAKRAKLKEVSPLINIRFESPYKADKGFEKLCKKEGLSVFAHGDGTVGLYPATTGKRGKQWEDYVDALRDDGQEI